MPTPHALADGTIGEPASAGELGSDPADDESFEPALPHANRAKAPTATSTDLGAAPRFTADIVAVTGSVRPAQVLTNRCSPETARPFSNHSRQSAQMTSSTQQETVEIGVGMACPGQAQPPTGGEMDR
jgi:hypothetical protein